MADNCVLNFSVVPKIDTAIKDLEHNNPVTCAKVSELVASKNFLEYVKQDAQGKDVTDLESFGGLDIRTIKRLIREYRNSMIFNVKNTVINNTREAIQDALYNFTSYEAFKVGLQYHVDTIAFFDITSDPELKRKKDYISTLISDVKLEYIYQLADIANKYGVFDVENDGFITVEDENGNTHEEFNQEFLNSMYLTIIEQGTEIEQNFKDFVRAVVSTGETSRRFWNEAFYNSKISHLRSDFEGTSDEDFKTALVYDEDENVFVDSDNYDDSVVSNEQWTISKTPANFHKLLSDRTKIYFNTLPRLASTVKTQEGWQSDKYNALGVTTFHNYQECSVEIITAINNMGGFKSKENFLYVLRTIAENKKEFAAFAKVAEDLEDDDDLFNKIYTDLNSFVYDKLEVRVVENGNVEVGQSNNNNNPIRKLFFNLRNDFKGSSLHNNNVENTAYVTDDLYQKYYDIKSGYDKYKNTKSTTLLNRLVEDENKLIEEIKALYKTYFPSIDSIAIDKYIVKHTNLNGKVSRLDNISTLLSMINEVTRAAKNTVVEYEKQDYARRKVFGENMVAERQYNEAVAGGLSGVKKPEPKPIPTFADFLIGAEKVLSDVANAFEPYTYCKAELNSRTVENKLSSDAGYNNMISNIVKICRDKELLNAWVKEKMQSTEYDYSNILIDNPEQGIKGLFRKTASGDYVLTEYGDTLIDTYLLNGAVNENTDANADYTKMSDADYFLTGFYAFYNETKGYRKYNTDKKYTVRTAPFLMRTPSDAPKNFAINMPKYSIGGLYVYDRDSITQYANEESERLKLNTVDLGDKLNELIGTPTKSQNVSIDDMATMLVNGQDSFKINKRRVLDTRTPKNGDVVRIAFSIADKDFYDFIIYEGIYNSENDKAFVTNAKVLGRAGTGVNVMSTIKIKLEEKFKREHPEAKTMNRKHAIFNAFKNILKGEIFDYYKALEDIKNHKKEDLIEWFHYNPKSDKPISALTGNAFTFSKLDNKIIEDIDARVKSILSSTGGQTLLSGYTSETTRNAAIDFSSIEEQLDELIEEWINGYAEYSIATCRNKFKHFVEDISDTDIIDYMLNAYIHFNNFDDLFEGNSKYYANPQTFLKRAKEVQAGGTSYAITNYIKNPNNTNPFSQSVENLGVGLGIQANGKEVGLRTGWYGVTIFNSVRGSSNADSLYKQLIAAGSTKEKAEEIAKGFGLPYTNEKGETKEDTTKVNDAQSYITIYEAARRLKILGEYNKYKKLISQLTDDTTRLEDINPNDLSGFIQVMKNFYFDHYYNDKFGRHLPRQIKNAEYVLVPKFLKDTSLGKLADIMIELGIDQVNTQETSKAANYSTLTFWDKNGEISEEAIEAFRKAAPLNKQAYSYMYLYKQQDVPQHILDAKNKAGIQVMKKVLDNIANFTDNNSPASRFVNAYVANIKEDFETLFDNYGIKFDSNYNIISKDGSAPNYKKVYDLALQEAARLGLDSNMIEYLRATDDGSPVMPNFMNVVASKIESIAQSQFNKFITRQKLPGWHAAQVTSVGMEKLIREYRREAVTDEGKRVELRYHPKIDGKQEAYAEVLLPKWAKSMFNQYDKDGNLIKEIRIEDCDEEVLKCLGYRIPTEGKQSMAILKVVGFLPEWAGSTIVVPDEWVSQTGSDFDVDSIYGISFETYLGKDGRVHKVQYVDGDNEDSAFIRYTRYVNENINKLIKEDFPSLLTDEEYAKLKERAKAAVSAEKEAQEQYYRDEVKSKIENEQTEAWNNLTEELKDKFKAIQKELKDNKVQFKDRVSRMLDEIRDLETQGYDEQSLQDFKKVYEELRDIISEQIDFARNVYEEIGDKLKGANKEHFRNSVISRAAAAELMTFEEFQRLSIESQNTRKARNNRILDSMIAIMASEESLEEQLSRSNFDDITDAIKAVDKLKGVSNTSVNVNNLFDQIQFHRNAMGGATLKAFSVARDTGTSVFNVTKAELAKPIYVKYGKNVDMNIAKQAFDTTEDGVVIHNRIGNSKNNKNVKGDFITVASSHTTAHILDAIKEGAIENENEYTFAAFKTLFDIGVDAYTAVLWIRQPGISRLNEAYYENQSVFQKGYGNVIYTAIKNVARELGVTVNGELVTNTNSIQDVLDALQEQYGEEFADRYQGSKISFDNNDDSGVNIIDVERMEDNLTGRGYVEDYESLLDEIATILQFSNINEKAAVIANHVKVMNPDKFGAKQTIYSTRKVLKDIAKLIKSKEADDIRVDGKPLIKAIYPSINADSPTGSVNIQTYLDANNSNSAYKPLDAFLRYSTIPSILVNRQLFRTENGDFVSAIEEIESYLDTAITEQVYNDFKKYVLSNRYKSKSDVISYPVYLDKFNHIAIDYKTDEIAQNGTPVEGEAKRVYGYGYKSDYDLTIKNLAKPTKDEVEAFRKLTPAQKVSFIQSRLSGGERTIFDYLKVDFYGWQYRKQGVSTQSIRFDDQQTDMEVIYTLFNEVFNNSNPLLRLTAIDLIKYAFIVEGYSFRKGNITKIIKNSALYTPVSQNGTGIIDDIKSIVDEVDTISLMEDNIYEDYIRSHSTMSQIKSYRVKYDEKNRASINIVNGTNGIYHFDLSSKSDSNISKEIGLVKEGKKDGNIVIEQGVQYINIHNKKRTTLYKVVAIKSGDNITDLYMYPLNLLETYESGRFSANVANNIYPSREYYEDIIRLLYSDIDKPLKDYVNEKHKLFTAEGIKSYKYTKPKTGAEDVLPSSETFVQELANQEGHGSVKQLVKYVNELLVKQEGKKAEKNIWIWVPDSTMDNAFKTRQKQVVQTIIDNNGIPRQYLISRLKAKTTNKGKNKKFSDAQQIGIIAAERNGIINMDDIYSISRYEPNNEEVKQVTHNSALDLDDAGMYMTDDVLTEASVSGKLAQQMTQDIKARARIFGNEDAIVTYKDIKSIGFSENNRDIIEARKEDTIKRAVSFYRHAADQIRKEMNEFTLDPDGGPNDYLPFDDLKVIEMIKNDEEKRNRYISLVLQASTFGKSIDLIYHIPEEELSKETKKLVNDLKIIIDDIRTSKAVTNGFNIINDHIWSKLSTNPLIDSNFTDIANYIVKDANTLDWLFQDTQELAIPIVQIILNQVKSKFNTRLMEIEPQVHEYKRKENQIIEAAQKAGVSINWEHIVNPATGRFIFNYDEKVFDDDRELALKVNNALVDYGRTSKEYLMAEHEYNGWLLKNKEQEYVYEYYKYKYENESKVINDDMIDYYIEYLTLKNEYHNLLGKAKASRTEDDQNRIRILRHKINQMSSIYDDVTGEFKDEKSMNKAAKLKAYLEENEKIRKAFFVRETRFGFNSDLEHYLKIIDKHNKKLNGKPLRSEYELLQIDEYAEAVDWLNENTVYLPNEEFMEKLNNAYAAMSRNGKKREYPQFTSIVNHTSGSKDAYGRINGLVFSNEQIEKIKLEQEAIYDSETNDTNGETKLIRNRPDNDEIYSEEFYKGFKSSDEKLNRRKNKTIKNINAILIKAVNHITGKVVLSDLSIDDLNNLAKLYDELRGIKSDEEKDEKVKDFIAKNVHFAEDNAAYALDVAAAVERDKFEKGYLTAFYKVAARREYDKAGNLSINRRKGNSEIYGYVTPKRKSDGSLVNPNFLDKKKTEARRFISNNVEMVTTQYYEEAKNKAIKEGKLEEWERLNHVYNPHTRRMEPLRIWMMRRYKNNIKSKFRPTYSNTKPKPKDTTINSNYDRLSAGYKEEGDYGKMSDATKYERELRDLMMNTIIKLAGENHTAMGFISQNFAPRRGRTDASIKNIAAATANALGFGQSLDPDRHFSKYVGYEHDKEANVPMLNHIKAKGHKQYIKLREKGITEDDAHYQEEVRKVREENEKIRKHNLELEAAAMDKDYSSVMEQFVREALLTQARQESKLDVYYLLEYLRSQHQAYKTNTFGGLQVDKDLTTADKKIYETGTAKNALEMVETWSKRFLFDEYRPKAKFDKAAAVMQNIASAKFMMMNITGGIGNVLTGSTNIFMERFAGEYFSHSAWEKAKFTYYLPNVTGFILNSNKSTSDNLIDGIIKLMGVVDYNGIAETARSINTIEIIEKLRNYAYSPQTSGEHFMQNTSMLAMMLDNRIVTEGGQVRIMSFANYTSLIEENVMKALLKDNNRLSKLYNDFIKNINTDKNKLKEYHWFKKDVNSEFLRTIYREGEIGKEVGEQYRKMIEDALKDAKEKFETYDSVIDQFELDKETGLAKLKKDSKINLRHLGKFKEKVVSVNKKIHGVYDKLGGAQIESRWVFGSLIMQYHKYIYMGAMKHWRINGYYNESRESIERGFIQSLWKFASLEFHDIGSRAKQTAEQENISKFRASMQIVCRSFINTFLNWQFNKNVMNEAERANVRRALGDFVGIAAGILAGIAANCMLLGADDDDEVYTKIASLALYQADRLSSEVAVFSYGAVSEVEKLYSNPLAIGQSFSDLQSAFGFIAKYLMEGDEFNPYYTTGRYKGEHKLKVYFERQIPIWRNIDRLNNIDQNNKYYKLGENMLSIIPAKDIAEWIME